jgi:hypothetical protein
MHLYILNRDRLVFLLVLVIVLLSIAGEIQRERSGFDRVKPSHSCHEHHLPNEVFPCTQHQRHYIVMSAQCSTARRLVFRRRASDPTFSAPDSSRFFCCLVYLPIDPVKHLIFRVARILADGRPRTLPDPTTILKTFLGTRDEKCKLMIRIVTEILILNQSPRSLRKTTSKSGNG